MNDDLHSFIEPELEARIVALILGEASAFEKEELERIIAERPEVAIWKRRIELVHGLVGEASQPDEVDRWTLSSERRERVLRVARKEKETNPFRLAEIPRRSERRQWFVVAAAVAICFVIFGLMTPSILKSKKNPGFAVFSEANRITDQERLDSEIQRLGDEVNDKQKALTVLTQQYGIPYFDGRKASPVGLTEERHYAFRISNEGEKLNGSLSSGSALASIGDAMISNEIAPPKAARLTDLPNNFFGATMVNEELKSEGITTQSVLTNTRHSGLEKDISALGEKVEGFHKTDSGLVDAPAAPKKEGRLGDQDQSDFAVTQTTSDGISFDVPPAAAPVPEARQDQRQEISRELVKLREVKLAEGKDFFYQETEGLRRAGEKTPPPVAVTASGALSGRAGGGGGMVDAAALLAFGFEVESLQLKREEVSSDPFSAPADDAKSVSAKPAQPTNIAIAGNEPKQIAVTTKSVEQKADERDNGREVASEKLFKGQNNKSLYAGNPETEWDEKETYKSAKSGLVREQQELTRDRGVDRISSGKIIEIPTSAMVAADESKDEGKVQWDVGFAEGVEASKDSKSVEVDENILSSKWKVSSNFSDEDGYVGQEEFVAESADSFRISARKGRRLSVDEGGAVAPAQDRLSRSQRGLNGGHGTTVDGVFVSGNEISVKTKSETGGVILGVDAEAKPAAIDRVSRRELISEGNTREGESPSKERKKLVGQLSDKLETLVSEKSDSTFSLNVSDVSFKLAKSALGEGRWPDASKVRSEEFVNAFDYGDTKPNRAEKVSCVIEQGSHPFMQQRSLMRVALSTAALGRNASTPLRLTILLDQSGSMERNDRAESVRRAFDLLAVQLTAADEVTLVGFARTPRLLAERVKGDQCAKLSQIVNDTPTEGGTNLEEALTVGLQLAKQQFLENAQNRIILLTDGAANLGDALPKTLSKEVEKMRRAGVAFDACGVGADGFNDDILSALTKQGDGRYYFLDRPEDADEGFARQIAGALRPSAKNVKVQVIFNPDRVERFNLYGFKKHKLNKEDFRNDSVDAAEMAAEESGVAMYHYQAMPQGRGDVGTVSVRFQDVASGKMIERTWNIPYEPSMVDFFQATPSLQLAGAAALFGEKLKGSVVGERVELGELRRSVSGVQGTFGGQRRFEELRTMLEQASR